MGREIFPAMSGGMRALRMLDVVSNNLANVNTTGFKADRPVFKLHTPAAAANYDPDSAEVRLAQAWTTLDAEATDFTQGRLQETGNPTDLALSGDGFFRLEDPRAAGRILVTRDGSFEIGQDGTLVNQAGLRVLGADDQPIKVGIGDFQVASDGKIEVDGRAVGSLAVVDVTDRTLLSKIGGNLFEIVAGTPLEQGTATVHGGRLEGSNVEPIRALTELIAVTRYYEAFKNTLQSSTELDRMLNQSVGKVTG